MAMPPARFLVVWGGQAVSELVGNMAYFALGIWVWQTTGSSLSFAATMIAGLLPGLLLGPLLAPAVDRLGPSRALLTTTLTLALLGFALLLLLHHDLLTVPLVISLLAIEDVIESAHGLGFATLVAGLGDEHIDRANGLLSIIDPAAAILGPTAGAALYAFWGLAPIVALDVAGYLLAAATVAYAGWRLSQTAAPSEVEAEDAHPEPTRRGEALVAAWHVMCDGPVLWRLTLVYSVLNFSLGIAAVLILPTLMLKTGGDVTLVGGLQGVGGVAGVVGGLAAAWLLPRLPSLPVILGGITVSVVLGPLVTALGNEVVYWVIGAWFAAFLFPAVGAAYQSLWLRQIPVGKVAQVLSLRRLLTMVTGPVGMLVGPVLAEGPARQWTEIAGVRGLVGSGETGAHALVLALACLLVVVVIIAAAPRLLRDGLDAQPTGMR